ncbi:hypothetical protein NG895_26670 [Aeoliella sp. ICT_H6.2]|uniref:Uncharacterized protein n=1 Tax=Aeoliella straminimaris TaxID=2954799 RepID=A0A9X2JK16_9BACT|nr:hypothetical protein [Aeoliella straminimaris]MCO6047503.1 hypothetical protein [Aeoliella straminimaris]
MPIARRVKSIWRDVDRFLAELDRYHHYLSSHGKCGQGWLLAFRNDFRQILFDEPAVNFPLARYLRDCPPERPGYCIAMWLLGRCAERTKSYGLAKLTDGDSPRIRRHLALALRRVESWPRLRRLAAEHPDDEFLTRLLSDASRQSFDRRLHRFSEHVDHSHEAEAALASRMPLWIRDTNWSGKPPKTASWIRVILKRIRYWVRGE